MFRFCFECCPKSVGSQPRVALGTWCLQHTSCHAMMHADWIVPSCLWLVAFGLLASIQKPDGWIWVQKLQTLQQVAVFSFISMFVPQVNQKGIAFWKKTCIHICCRVLEKGTQHIQYSSAYITKSPVASSVHLDIEVNVCYYIDMVRLQHVCFPRIVVVFFFNTSLDKLPFQLV
jgi:hypothetical protein